MRVEHTWASRMAVVAIGVLTLLQLAWLVLTDDGLVLTAGAPVTLLSAFATWKMRRDNCFESRLAAVLAATGQLVGVALASTVGLPGRPRYPLDLHLTASLVAATAVLVLVALDQLVRARRMSRGGGVRTYAS